MRARLAAAMVLATLLAGAAGVLAPAASADVFGPISLISTNPAAGEQADLSLDPVVSGDGRYVAFYGSFAGVSGIWRRDLTTGAVEPVAPAPARLPSISADGRYVSFTTGSRLNPRQDHNEGPDVYVRDMDVPCSLSGTACLPCPEEEASSPCPFTLVSAVDGSAEGATYETPFNAAKYGSIAAGRSAMSADGRYVAFETTAESNLLGAPTPPLQILVRDLQTERTRLVSAEYDPAAGRPADGEDVPVPLVDGTGVEEPGNTSSSSAFGAAYSAGGVGPAFVSTTWLGASISADGSTVAWLGQDIERQAPMLPGEAEQPPVAEPLVRRIADGPTAPTERVTGGNSPAGPFGGGRFNELGLWGGAGADFVPKLSADGRVVAFVSTAPEAGSGSEISGVEGSTDLYVADVPEAGPGRAAGLRRLTEITGGEWSRLAPVRDFAISPDGTQVAFTSQRTVFALSSPAYISAPAPVPGMLELFDADLANSTLTRVTHGFVSEAEPSAAPHAEVPPGVEKVYGEEQGASWPSFSSDGDTLSFGSTADNLAYGDGNGQADTFVVDRELFSGASPPQSISPPPPNPSTEPEWRLGVRTSSLPDGSVLVDVAVPGAGAVTVQATGIVPARLTVAHTSPRSARRRGHAADRRRVVASASSAAGSADEGLVQLRVRLAPPYRALAARPGGLYATVSVTLRASGHPPIHGSAPTTFVRRASRRAHRAAHRRARGGR
jgi:hypothetical protein